MREANKAWWIGAVLAAALAWPFALSGGEPESRQPRAAIAQVEVGPALVEWLPQVDHESLVLTIAGPGDLYIQREFGSGEVPVFSSLDVQGGNLQDGIYAYELRAVPRRSPELREKIARAREAGDDAAVNKLVQGVNLPAGQMVQSGHLWVQGGSFVDKTPIPPDTSRQSQPEAESPLQSVATTTIPDDLVVQGQACIGPDCVDGDADGPVLKLKSFFSPGQLQIKFEAANCCFPFEHVWALQANENDSGPKGDFTIRDLTNSSIPFRILASSLTNNALTIFFNGHLGLGTSVPAQDVHVISGSSPAIRLEQTGGVLPVRAWDAVGNDAGFFVRDVTNGSAVPFRIGAGAPASSIEVTSAGKVGIGTASPTEKLDVDSGKIGIGGHTLGERTLSGANPNDLEVNSLRNTMVNVDSDNNSTNASFSVFRNSDLSQAVFVAREDNTVGINRSTPSFPLHVGSDATNGNGAHVTAAGVWTNGSSRTNKENIRMLATEDAFAALSGLEPVRYTGRNSHDGEEYLGFIAEDVPELVAMSSRQGLSPMDIVAVLTKVIQEREKTINELARRLAQVETALEAVAKN